MPEAVIVSAVRSPIGRAMKGSLKSLRPDDMAAQIVAAALAKVPELDPTEIDDLLLGCGQPAGQSGFNIARTVADGLLQQGLVPRTFPAGHPLATALRITVRSAEQNDRLIEAARTVAHGLGSSHG